MFMTVTLALGRNGSNGKDFLSIISVKFIVRLNKTWGHTFDVEVQLIRDQLFGWAYKMSH